MTIYRIEPGDWECATGESVDSDVVVRKVVEGGISKQLLLDLGFDEMKGVPKCLEREAEWGHLQVWVWDSELEWFVAGESLGEDGPKNADDLIRFMRMLGLESAQDRK